MLDWESNIRIETVYISSVTFQLRFVKETGPILRVTETWAWTFLGNKTEMLKNQKFPAKRNQYWNLSTSNPKYPPTYLISGCHLSSDMVTWHPNHHHHLTVFVKHAVPGISKYTLTIPPCYDMVPYLCCQVPNPQLHQNHGTRPALHRPIEEVSLVTWPTAPPGMVANNCCGLVATYNRVHGKIIIYIYILYIHVSIDYTLLILLQRLNIWLPN